MISWVVSACGGFVGKSLIWLAVGGLVVTIVTIGLKEYGNAKTEAASEKASKLVYAAAHERAMQELADREEIQVFETNLDVELQSAEEAARKARARARRLEEKLQARDLDCEAWANNTLCAGRYNLLRDRDAARRTRLQKFGVPPTRSVVEFPADTGGAGQFE